MAPRPPKHDLTVNVDNEVRVVKSNAPDAVAERKRRALEVLAETGGNKAKACRLLGMRESNLYYWIDTDEAFAEAVQSVRKLARRVRAEKMEDTIEDLALGKTTKDGVPHFQAAKFLLEHDNPEEFGNTVTHEHKGTVYHSLIERAKPLDELPVVEMDEPNEIEVPGGVVEDDDD